MKKTILLVVIVLMFGWTIYEFVSDSNQESEPQTFSSSEETEIEEAELEPDMPEEEEVQLGLGQGQRAPDFQLLTLAGEDIRLSDFRGTRVMLNFWGSWCPPCVAEMPDMERLYQEHDIQILAVNLTPTETSISDVSDFIEELNLTFTIPLDEELHVAELYQIQPVPTSYMIDSEGIIQQKAIGALNYEQMVNTFDQIN